MRLNYDRNEGVPAHLHDRVIVCHTNSDMDGITGTIGGWYGDFMIALVALDEPLPSGETILSMPVVCLRPVGLSKISIMDDGSAQAYVMLPDGKTEIRDFPLSDRMREIARKMGGVTLNARN